MERASIPNLPYRPFTLDLIFLRYLQKIYLLGCNILIHSFNVLLVPLMQLIDLLLQIGDNFVNNFLLLTLFSEKYLILFVEVLFPI
jgi:hypothetical protein